MLLSATSRYPSHSLVVFIVHLPRESRRWRRPQPLLIEDCAPEPGNGYARRRPLGSGHRCLVLVVVAVDVADLREPASKAERVVCGDTEAGLSPNRERDPLCAPITRHGRVTPRQMPRVPRRQLVQPQPRRRDFLNAPPSDESGCQRIVGLPVRSRREERVKLTTPTEADPTFLTPRIEDAPISTATRKPYKPLQAMKLASS